MADEIGFEIDARCGRDGCDGTLRVHGCLCPIYPPPCWWCTDGEELECDACGEVLIPCREHEDCRDCGEMARECRATAERSKSDG